MKDEKLQTETLKAAIESLAGTPPAKDPVLNFFAGSISGIDLSGKAQAKANGTVSEKLAFLQAESEKEFVKQFYITGDEVSEVKKASKAKDEAKLEELMK